MRVAKNNTAFRVMITSQFVNNLGSSFFNIVFLVYAATLPNKTLSVTLVAFTEMLPTLFSIIVGNFADKTKHHLRSWRIARLSQSIIFLIITVILIFFDGQFWSFLILLLLVFVSSVVGSYSNLLMKPVSRFILSDSDLQEAMSLEQTVSVAVNLIGGFSGVALLGILHQNYAGFSLINAGMFVIAWSIMALNHRQFLEAEQHIEAETKPNTNTSIFSDLKSTFIYVYKDHLFFQILLLATAINFVGTSFNGVFNLTLLHNKSLLIGNFGTTVAIFGAISSIGLLTGSLITNDFFKKLTTKQLIGISGIGIVLIAAVPLFYPNGVLWMLIIFLFSYIEAKINPKLGAILMKRIDRNRLAGVSGLINTFVMSATPLGQIIFLGTANIYSPNISWFFMGFVASLITIYTILTRQQDMELVEKTRESAIL
jgi:MFS family permease